MKVLELGLGGPRPSGTGQASGYMAPEQALGRTNGIDGRTDQFALAAITYAMLTGRDPFSGDDPSALLYQVVHEQPAPLARFLSWDVSRVQTVLSRGLAKDQDMRYDGVLDFARALEGAVFHTSVAVPGDRRDRRGAGRRVAVAGQSRRRRTCTRPRPRTFTRDRPATACPGRQPARGAAGNRWPQRGGGTRGRSAGSARSSRRSDTTNVQYDWELPARSIGYPSRRTAPWRWRGSPPRWGHCWW